MTQNQLVLEALNEKRERAREALVLIDETIRAHIKGARTANGIAKSSGGGKRIFTAAARERMSEAQRKRWAEKQNDAAAPAPLPPPVEAKSSKARISVAGRKRLAAATKKRWADAKARGLTVLAGKKVKAKTHAAGA
jgi:hypothetical protein